MNFIEERNSIKDKTTSRKVRFIRIRVILGEASLILALFFFFIVLVMSYQFIFLAEEYPFAERTLIYARNWILFILFAFGGSFIGFGRATPFSGRKFDPTFEIVQQKFGSFLWRSFILIIGILFSLYALLGILGIVLLWEQGDIYSLLFEHFPFDVPATIFAVRWVYAYYILNPKRLPYIERVKDKPITSTILNFHSIKNVISSREVPKFEVKKPSIIKWILILIITSLLNIMLFMFTLSSDFFLILIIISVFLSLVCWRFLTPWITRIFLINSLKKWNDQIKYEKQSKQNLSRNLKINPIKKVFLYLIGLNLSLEKTYYLETEPNHVNLNDIRKIFKERGLELILTCMAVIFLYLYTFNPVLNIINIQETDPYSTLVYVSIALIFSPVFIFWLIPVMWIVNDLNIKSVDRKQTVVNLVDNIKASQLDRFLGIGGLFAGIGFIALLLETFPEVSAYAGNWPNAGALIFDALLTLFMVVFLFAGVAYIVGILYLTLSHQKIVNRFRKELSELLPVCTTLARKATTEEEEIFKKAVS